MVCKEAQCAKIEKIHLELLIIIQHHRHVKCLLGPIFSSNGEETHLDFWVGNFISKSSSPSLGLFLYQVKPSSKGITKIGPVLNHCHIQALIWVMPSPEDFTLHITSILSHIRNFQLVDGPNPSQRRSLWVGYSFIWVRLGLRVLSHDAKFPTAWHTRWISLNQF